MRFCNHSGTLWTVRTVPGYDYKVMGKKIGQKPKSPPGQDTHKQSYLRQEASLIAIGWPWENIKIEGPWPVHVLSLRPDKS